MNHEYTRYARERKLRSKKELQQSVSIERQIEQNRNRGFSLPTAVITVKLKTFANENYHEFPGIAAFSKDSSTKFCARGPGEHVGSNPWKFTLKTLYFNQSANWLHN